MECPLLDKDRAFTYTKTYLKSSACNRYTNLDLALFPIVRGAKNPTRAKACVQLHKKKVARLASYSVDGIINLDKKNRRVTDTDGNQVSLREILLDIRACNTSIPLIKAIDVHRFNPERCMVTFSKMHETEAINILTGLWCYLHFKMNFSMEQLDKWFTEEAIDEGMTQEWDDERYLVKSGDWKELDQHILLLMDEGGLTPEEAESIRNPTEATTGKLVISRPTRGANLLSDDITVGSLATAQTTATNQSGKLASRSLLRQDQENPFSHYTSDDDGSVEDGQRKPAAQTSPFHTAASDTGGSQGTFPGSESSFKPAAGADPASGGKVG